MALTPTDNTAFLREVDEELRRDQAQQFVRRYGRWLILGVGLLLAAVGAGLWWQNHRTEQAGKHAEALTQAIADVSGGAANEARGRTELEAIAKDGSAGYAVAARMTLADLMLDKGDTKGAAAAFAAIAADTDVAQPFRDLATVRGTVAEFDTLPPGTVRARLAGLTQPGSAFFGSAGEMVAVSLLKENKRAEAGQMFARLARDAGVPPSLRSRAVQMAGVLGVTVAPLEAGAGQGTIR